MRRPPFLRSRPLLRSGRPRAPARACAVALAAATVALGTSCPGASAGYLDRDARNALVCPAANGFAPMDYVPAGPFRGGATREEVELADYDADIPREPRPPGEFATDAFCIDRFEFPGEGRKPVADVTWLQARVTCELLGRRLCTENEWAKACGGVLGDLYPYGDEFVPGLCNSDVPTEGSYDRTTPGGTYPTCAGPYGTQDLEGNLSEWAEDGPEPGGHGRWVLGGTMWPGVYGRSCQARHAHPQVAPVSGDDGFRCCADAIDPS